MAETETTTDDAPEVLDATDADPAEIEASGADTVTVTYGGHAYTIPATVDDWSIDALELAERGQPARLLNAVLGPDQYAQFKSRHSKVRELREMSDQIARVSGFGSAGN